VKMASQFDVICEKLEEVTSFNRLEARGTLRIALKESGLEAKTVRPDQLEVVIERVLPQHLRDRGVEDPEKICQVLIAAIPRGSADDSTKSADSPEAIFERLGSR
jgi:hypothetical protein